MATKKPTKRRRRKALSAPSRRRRSSGGRRKGLLADIMNPTIAMNSAKSTLAAAGGGMAAVTCNKVIFAPTTGKMMRVGTALVGGFLASAFGMPSVGSGFTGGLFALTFQNGLMADDGMEEETEFADENVLADQPIFLDENDNPMVLEEGEGEPYYRYLSEEELMEYEGSVPSLDY